MTKQLLNAAPEGTILALEEIDHSLSIEALSLSNLAVQVRRVVPTLVDSATAVLSKFTGKQSKLVNMDLSKLSGFADGSAAVAALPAEYRAFQKMVEKHPYVDLMPLRFYVPEGFQGNFLSYTQLLINCQEHANDIVANVLNPFAQFLSRIITNKDATMRTTRDLAFLSKSDVVRKGLTGEIGGYFQPGSTSTKSNIGKVMQRNADWNPLFTNLMELQRKVAELKPETVEQSISDVVELLTAVKAAAAAGELDNSSPETLKTLSHATLSCAEEAEFYAITTFRGFTLGVIMAQNFKEIPEMMK